jgi:cytidyltransferase-like protein
MKYHQGLSDVPLTSTPSVFILGSFDGLHLGHQYLLSQGRSLANALGLPLSVMTFSYKEPYLITPEHKRRLFERLDVDLLIDVPFSKSLKNLTADAFVALLQRMVPVHTWVGGADLRFGKDQEGSCEFLTTRTDLKAHVVERLAIGGETVSSTRIRRLVASGDLPLAATLLGRPYSVVAPAVRLSDQNCYALDLSHLCLPPSGEYGATVNIEGCPQAHSAVLHIEETCFVSLVLIPESSYHPGCVNAPEIQRPQTVCFDDPISQPAILEVVL